MTTTKPDPRTAFTAIHDGSAVPDGADAAVSRADLARAWARLSPVDQEVLSLTVFEGLESAAAGSVLGISAASYRVHLSRARAALRRSLGNDAPERDAATHTHLRPVPDKETP